MSLFSPAALSFPELFGQSGCRKPRCQFLLFLVIRVQWTSRICVLSGHQFGKLLVIISSNTSLTPSFSPPTKCVFDFWKLSHSLLKLCYFIPFFLFHFLWFLLQFKTPDFFWSCWSAITLCCLFLSDIVVFICRYLNFSLLCFLFSIHHIYGLLS